MSRQSPAVSPPADHGSTGHRARAGALVVEWAVRHDGREVLRSHGCGSVADGTELVVRSGAPADTVYEIWQQIDESAAFIRLVHRGTVR